MARRLLKKQIRVVQEGGDPIGVTFDPAKSLNQDRRRKFLSPDRQPTMNRHEFLQKLPKVGAALPSLRHGPQSDFCGHGGSAESADYGAQIDEYYTRARKPWPTNNVMRALDQYLVKEPDDLYRLAFEYLEDAAPHTVRYAEFFWNPTATVLSGIPFACRTVSDRPGHSRRRSSLRHRRPPDTCDRSRARQRGCQEMVEWVIKNRVPEVPGIGMDFDEVPHPPELFAELIDVHATPACG